MKKIKKRAIIKQSGSFTKEYLAHLQVYRAAIKEVTTKLEILDEEFSAFYKHNPIHNIETRLKTPESVLKKLREHKLPQTIDAIEKNITDVAGVRVVCNYIDDIYTIKDLLTSQRDISLLEVDDYIKEPKESGYRSLHLIITVPVFLSKGTRLVPVEVQLRTIAMDFWASLEHTLRYKESTEMDSEISRRLNGCAEVIASVDNEMQSIHNIIKSGRNDENTKGNIQPTKE